MKNDHDFILIAQSNIVDYDSYNLLDPGRLDLYKSLVYPRMVRVDSNFVSHLDYINLQVYGRTYSRSSYQQRRDMLNIWNIPSMSGLHLQNYAKSRGYNPYVINNLDSEVDCLSELLANAPDLPIVISTTFYLQWKEVFRIVGIVRNISSNSKIILGGAFVNSFFTESGSKETTRNLLKHRIDFCVHSFNSESDLFDLLDWLQSESSISPPNNCLLLDGSSYIETPIVWNSPLLAEIKPIWHELDIPSLKSTLQIRSASGCPFSCSFCSYPTTAKVWETSSEEEVRLHLDSLAKIPNLKNIIFIDDTFNVPVNRFKSIVNILKEYDFGWYSFLRVQFVDDDIVRAMKDSGCKGVYLGIESSNDHILSNMNKQARRSDFARGVALLNKYDIDYVAAFVLGFPGETLSTIHDNITFITEMNVKYYALKEFYYMHNTKVHRDRNKYNLSGSGGRWKHATMTYSEATNLKLDMFMSIPNSIHLDPDTSLWHLAHLDDLGFRRDVVRDYQIEINELIREDLLSNSSSRSLV